MLLKQKFDENYNSDLVKNKTHQICFVLFLISLPITMIWFVNNLDYRANLYPISLSTISIFLLIFILVVKIFDLRKMPSVDNMFMNFAKTNIYELGNGFNNQLYYYLSFVGYLAMNFIVGFPIASVLFINLFIVFHDKKAIKVSITISAVLIVILWFLASLLTLQFPNGAIGLIIDMPWWLGGDLN